MNLSFTPFLVVDFFYFPLTLAPYKNVILNRLTLFMFFRSNFFI